MQGSAWTVQESIADNDTWWFDTANRDGHARQSAAPPRFFCP